MKELLTVMMMIFLAELGDKTQLATMMFASNKLANPTLVFVGASRRAPRIICLSS